MKTKKKEFIYIYRFVYRLFDSMTVGDDDDLVCAFGTFSSCGSLHDILQLLCW